MTLTKRLLLLALISVLPTIVMWTYTEVSLRRAREAEVNDLVIRQARVAASELERIFDGIHSLLIAVDEAPSIRSFIAPACNSYLASLQQKVPYLLAFVALDLEGRVRCVQGPMPGGDYRFNNRPYFRDVLRTEGFVVGTYTPEFLEGGVGAHPVLPLGLPIRDDEGRITGVIAAALDLRWLNQKLKERVIPAGGSVTIADRNGIIIAREPLSERFLGTKIPEPFMKYVNDNKVGSFEAMSQDGVKRILGYIPLNVQPTELYISAGLSSKSAFETINKAATRGFMLIAAGLVLSLSVSWLLGRAFITRPFEIMTDAVRAWRRGNYLARIELPGSTGELGVLAHAFNDLMDDVAERQKALQASEERARLALDAGHMGTWWYDHLKGMGGWSSQAALLLGLPPEKTTVTIEEWRELVHPDDVETVFAKLRGAVQGDGEYEDEYRVRHADGETRWINSKGRVFFNSARKPVYFVGIFQDVTARKRAEDQQRFLLDELNHRVKNTLATVQSIAAQTLRSADGPASFKEAFEGRLLALSKTHDLLTRKSWREADLHELVKQELAPYRKSRDERVFVRGPNVDLPARYAINFGLVLHELVTNAAKYGALSSPSGRLEVTWTVIENTERPPQLRLHWRESGGPPVEKPKRQGFGSRLIRRSIEGELAGYIVISFAPTGVSYDLSVPLPVERSLPVSAA
ncbi:sensor histidine kinase [Microvirga subterranea]|uniref:Blue-light-activated histidine kinase n=1 Tax=Microvirga subterranea TaxID=186651 RepID=A0A370HL80_9HYPH|nr:HWE histidine kinase domain-containing protein [Microvirga subterranea]RDI58915.1 PAS domain S-box-containing protein [Microvirga subterranea]